MLQEPLDVTKGPSMEQTMSFAARLGIPEAQQKEAAESFIKLYELFMSNDTTLLEINPLSLDYNRRIVCMDCKMNFDDNAAFRRKEIFSKKVTQFISFLNQSNFNKSCSRITLKKTSEISRLKRQI